MKPTRLIPLLIAIPMTAASLPGVAPQGEAAPAAQTPDAAAMTRAKALFSEKCSACHNLPDPVEKSLTRSEWQGTVNKMLTKYGASDSISNADAAQIVDYLATFAPSAASAAKPLDIWATDRVDVWTVDPTRTVVTNFEAPAQLTRLTQETAGDKAGSSVWRIVPESGEADGSVVRVTSAGAGAGHFAILRDPTTNARDIDVSMRFRVDAGKTSPAVGIAFGLKSATDYQLIRYDAMRQQIALMQIQEPQHVTVQKTDIASGADVLQAAPLAASTLVPSGAKQWHTLRVLVNGTTVRACIDMTKRISFDDTAYRGGAVGLWSQGDTTAVFDDWTTDIYDQPSAGV